MAKLIKHVSASLRAKTHDDSDTAMRERGATGVFRNLAFQEEEDDCKASPSKAPMTVVNAKKGKLYNTDTASSLDISPLSKEAPTPGMWATPPATPPTGSKRFSSTCQGTPTKSLISAHRQSSSLRRSLKQPHVDEITAFDGDGGHASDSEDCAGGAAVAHAPRGGGSAGPNGFMLPACTTSSVRAWEEDVKRLIAAGRHEDAVRLVAPSDGMIRCTVRRVKNFLGNTLAYHLYLDAGDAFLLAARKRKKSKASNFVLSTSQEELSRESAHCVAKLRANFVGTEYALVGRVGGGVAGGAGTGGGSVFSSAGGGAVASDDEDGAAAGGGRLAPPPELFSREEVAVHYKQTALKTKAGPRFMLVATPLPETCWAPCAADGSDSLASCLELARRRELAPRLERQLCMLATRPPEYDPQLKAYTLDFHGRVRASSVKNFQLVHWDHNTDRRGSDLALQYGKIEEGSDDFALDFTYPLNIEKAFAIALASTDSKLCTAI